MSQEKAQRLYSKWIASLSEADNMPTWETAESNFLYLFELFFTHGMPADIAEQHKENAVTEHAITLPRARRVLMNAPSMKATYSSAEEYMKSQYNGLLRIANQVFFSIYPLDETEVKDIAEQRKEVAKRKKRELERQYADQFETIDINNLPDLVVQPLVDYDELFAEDALHD